VDGRSADVVASFDSLTFFAAFSTFAITDVLAEPPWRTASLPALPVLAFAAVAAFLLGGLAPFDSVFVAVDRVSEVEAVPLIASISFRRVGASFSDLNGRSGFPLSSRVQAPAARGDRGALPRWLVCVGVHPRAHTRAHMRAGKLNTKHCHMCTHARTALSFDHGSRAARHTAQWCMGGRGGGDSQLPM
jgi:hypothetical protein